MASLRALVILLLSAATPAAAAPSGHVETDGVMTELLPPPPPPGTAVRRPEGFLRVERGSGGDEAGTLTIEHVDPRQRFDVAAEPGSTPAAAVPKRGPPAPPPVEPCRAEREAYARELWRMAGITGVDPLALTEGLVPYGAAPASLAILGVVDPIRPLAWDLMLRSAARDLAKCVSPSQPFPELAPERRPPSRSR